MCGFFFVYYYYHDNISLNKIQILYVWYGWYAKVDVIRGSIGSDLLGPLQGGSIGADLLGPLQGGSIDARSRAKSS
jgi:hypothetical protein